MDYQGEFLQEARWCWTDDFVIPAVPQGHACFAGSKEGKRDHHKYFWFFLNHTVVGKNNYPILSSYFKDVLRLFPKACMVVPGTDNYLVFVLNFENYVWHPTEFLACLTLLRNAGEYPRDVLGYTTFRQWGCTISQAVFLSQFYHPDTMKDWTLNGAKLQGLNRPFSGHSFAVCGVPTTLVGYSIPDITKTIRAKEGFKFKDRWDIQRTYGSYKLDEMKRPAYFISEEEVKKLIAEAPVEKPKARKRNAGDYVL